MDEPAEITGEIVEHGGEIEVLPPAAEMRYTDDRAVARVFIRVEYADGRIREYQAREPQDFQASESMSIREAGFKVSAGGLFMAPSVAVPLFTMSFTANPRHNLHIRTEATAPAEFEGISYR